MVSSRPVWAVLQEPALKNKEASEKKQKKKGKATDMVMQIYNLSSQEVEARLP